MKRNLMKRLAAAVVTLALLVGAAGPVASNPPADDSTVEVAAPSYFGGYTQMVYRYGGSWS